MDRCSNHDHPSYPTTSSVHQTLDEMDFERGIWTAAMSGDVDKTREHLRKGTSPDAEDKSGYTALHYAARSGHAYICSLLLKNGASVNKKTRAGGATALHRAAMTGNYEICRILVDFKADLSTKDVDGRTPLHRAVEGGHNKIITLFLQTDPTVVIVKDNQGRTPKDLASQDDSLFSLFTDHQKIL